MTVDHVLENLSSRDLLELAVTIARKFHIDVREMFARTKTKPGPEARAAFYAHLIHVLGWSYPRIGELVGRDHSTIQYAVKKCGPRVEVESRVRVAS